MLEVILLMVSSVRNSVILYSSLFFILVLSVNDFDTLYFAFVFMGGLMIINFLMLVSDIGNVFVSLSLVLVLIPFFHTSLMFEYLYMLVFLFFILFL